MIVSAKTCVPRFFLNCKRFFELISIDIPFYMNMHKCITGNISNFQTELNSSWVNYVFIQPKYLHIGYSRMRDYLLWYDAVMRPKQQHCICKLIKFVQKKKSRKKIQAAVRTNMQSNCQFLHLNLQLQIRQWCQSKLEFA